jgi:hypothetical protein
VSDDLTQRKMVTSFIYEKCQVYLSQVPHGVALIAPASIMESVRLAKRRIEVWKTYDIPGDTPLLITGFLPMRNNKVDEPIGQRTKVGRLAGDHDSKLQEVHTCHFDSLPMQPASRLILQYYSCPEERDAHRQWASYNSKVRPKIWGKSGTIVVIQEGLVSRSLHTGDKI